MAGDGAQQAEQAAVEPTPELGPSGNFGFERFGPPLLDAAAATVGGGSAVIRTAADTLRGPAGPTLVLIGAGVALAVFIGGRSGGRGRRRRR